MTFGLTSPLYLSAARAWIVESFSSLWRWLPREIKVFLNAKLADAFIDRQTPPPPPPGPPPYFKSPPPPPPSLGKVRGALAPPCVKKRVEAWLRPIFVLGFQKNFELKIQKNPLVEIYEFNQAG